MAFKDYHFHNSTFVKRFVFWYRLVAPILILVPLLFIASLTPPGATKIGIACLGIAMALGFAVYAERIAKHQMRSTKKQVLAGGNYTKFLGPQELTVTETGIQTHSDYLAATLAWEAIDHIASTPQHTFIYLSRDQAYIIPHDHMTEGDLPALLAELGRRCQPGQALQSSGKRTS